MTQNIKHIGSIEKSREGSFLDFYSDFRCFSGKNRENYSDPKQKLMHRDRLILSPKTGKNQPNVKKKALEFDPYLDLFIQLNVIEDSFDFVRLIFYFDPFQCVYAGSAFENVYGRSCKEIYEHTDLFYEAAHPDDSDFLMKQIKKLLKNGYHEFTYRIVAKNGDIKYLKTNAWCQQDQGLSYFICCYQKDITSLSKSPGSVKKNLQKHRDISDIAITFNSVDNFEHKLQSVVNKIGNSLKVDQVSLYEIDNEQKQMLCRYVWAKQDPLIPAGVVVEMPPLKKLPEYINALHFSAGEERSGFMRYWNTSPQTRSLTVVPIRIEQKMFGFIELISTDEKRSGNDDDLSFVGTVGNMTANFYDRKAINDELNLNYLKQELLANVSYRLNQYTDDNDQALETVLAYIGMKKPDTERIFIYRYDEGDMLFQKTHEYVNPLLDPQYDSRDEYDSMLFSDIIPLFKAGQSFCVNDTTQLRPELQSIARRLNLKSLLAVPMSVNGRLYGVYGYDIYSHQHTWKKNEMEVARSFADTISHFIERQTIMKKLRAGEKRFKDISEKLPGCVFQVTLARKDSITVNYISPQFEQWLKKKPSEKILLEKIRHVLHPGDSEAFAELEKDLECRNPEISFEGRFYFPSIGFKWLIVKAGLSEITSSEARVYNGMLIDATENKQTELKLADANMSIQSIINNLETGVLLVDDYDNVLYMNDRLSDMLASVKGPDATPTPLNQILNATYDLVRDNVNLKNHTESLMKDRVEERGKELFFYQSAEFATRDYIPVFRDHRFFAHLFIFNNVTHRKLQDLEIRKAYKRVRTVIDYSDIGVLLLSENETVLIVNDRYLKIHNIKEPADNFVNHPFRTLWEKMNESVLMDGIGLDMIRDVVHAGRHIVDREITIDGTGTFRCFVEPVADDEAPRKEMHETLIRMIDITGQKNIESSLRKAKEEAEVIAKAKSHILTTMSHEIRTPLNGILGFSTMLKESLTDPYQREMAEVIDQSGQRLMNTLNAILDFSDIQSEKRAYKISSVSVNKIIWEQIGLHRPQATEKGLYLYAEIKGRISIAIAEQILYKILHNLIDNAIKYTSAGGIKIEANIVLIESAEYLELKVIDTGAGIDEGLQETIFEPFRQGSEGYGRAFEGTGLGLSLVKEYVQKMNGRIHLKSRKNAGSTFTVLLPNVYFENSDISTQTIGLPPEV